MIPSLKIPEELTGELTEFGRLKTPVLIDKIERHLGKLTRRHEEAVERYLKVKDDKAERTLRKVEVDRLAQAIRETRKVREEVARQWEARRAAARPKLERARALEAQLAQAPERAALALEPVRRAVEGAAEALIAIDQENAQTLKALRELLGDDFEAAGMSPPRLLPAGRMAGVVDLGRLYDERRRQGVRERQAARAKRAKAEAAEERRAKAEVKSRQRAQLLAKVS